jgi:hypothetical protein
VKLKAISIDGNSDGLLISFRLSPEGPGDRTSVSGVTPTRLPELLKLISDCSNPPEVTDGFTHSGQPRVRFSARVSMEGASSVSAVIASGETATTTVECQVVSPSGEMHYVHLPLEFRAEVMG